MSLATAAILPVPQLGPSLGVLVRPAGQGERPRAGPALDEPRLALVAAVIDLAGDARRWSEAGDREAAVEAIGAVPWRAAWDAALDRAAGILVESLEAELNAAAGESRLPRRLRNGLPLTPAERLAIVAHLGAGAGALGDVLEALASIADSVRSGRPSAEARQRWSDALLASARKTETAWRALEAAAAEEWKQWAVVVDRVRAWRRPRRGLWLITAAVLIVALLLGLVLGGYLPVPQWLRPLAEWWWAL